MDFAKTLIAWYLRHKRDLPWRKTRDPYKIWLSEVILQQTRVQQGLSYYSAFVKKYPDIRKLAAAPEKDVLKLWQGLGYYSRARNLHAAAKMIASEYNGKFPASYHELIRLKGVGDYTAAAVASICFGEAQPVVDGNVFRVLSRVFGIHTPIDSTNGKKEFRALAASLMDTNDPALYNQAVMEFGALQCVPKSPDCSVCPFLLQCEAQRKKEISLLPVKAKKTKVTDRFFYYLVIRYKNGTFIRQRNGKDIWKGLHDFPLIETQKKISEKELLKTKEWKNMFGENEITVHSFSDEVRHILSHQRLHVRFIEIETKKKLQPGEDCFFVKDADVKKYAVPVLIENYLEKMADR